MFFRKFLGEIMTELGFITKHQLEEALKAQKSILDEISPVFKGYDRIVSESRQAKETEKNPLLGQILKNMGYVTKEQLERAISEQNRPFEIYKTLENGKLSILIEICTLVNSSLNLVEVLDLIMKYVNSVIKSVASSLILIDSETGELVLSVPMGVKSDELTDIRLSPEDGVASLVVKYGKSVLIQNVKDDPRFGSRIDKIRGIEIESILGVPLMVKNKLIGVIEVINKVDGGSFIDEDMLILNIFAHHAAFAIENARLHSDLREKLEEQKLTEMALRESEAKWRALTEYSPDHIMMLDENANILFVNHALEGLNKDDMINRSIYDYVTDENRVILKQCFNKVLRTGESDQFEAQYITRKGSKQYLEGRVGPIMRSGKVVALTVSSRNVTPNKQMEKQLHQAQKMEAIGTLAGGIAHDFNNLLFPIMGYTEMLIEKSTAGGFEMKCLTEVLNAAARAKNLVHQILTFSRKNSHELKPLRIQFIMNEALRLLRSSLPSTIEIIKNIDKNCGQVLSDPTQIHQIIMNLCTNAYHAMQKNGGRLTVSLKEVEIGIDDIFNLDIHPGPYVQLTVADTGEGIDRSIIERIFEPYFTTKDKDKGTGLGLAVVHGIVKTYGGEITVKSEIGMGTEFRIFLPRTEVESGINQIESEICIPEGNEHILLVDDEDLVLNMVELTLMNLGYRVTAQASSTNAWDLFRNDPGLYDLVLTDMTMPKMTGLELSEKMLSVRKDIPIVLFTGFNENISEEQAKKAGIKEFIMKPLIRKDMAMIIRKVLDDRDTL